MKNIEEKRFCKIGEYMIKIEKEKVPSSRNRLFFGMGLSVVMLFASLLFCAGIAEATTITVHPGESIQVAIDSLPSEGGIVELTEGTWNISSTIHIIKSNITLKGQGMNKTILTRATPGIYRLIDINKAGDAVTRQNWHYNNKDQSWIYSYPKNPFNFSAYLWNVTIRDLCIKGGGESSGDNYGIFATELLDSTIEFVKTETHAMVGLQVADSVNVTVRDCVSISDGEAIMFFGDASCNIIGNTITGAWRYDGFETNGVWRSPYTELPEYPKPMILRNKVRDVSSGGIWIYSTSGAIVSENIAENCGRYGMAVAISKNCLISENILRKNQWSGLQYKTTDEYLENNFIRNIIYDNSEYGFKFLRTRLEGQFGGNIISNTIWNNGKDGIYDPYEQQSIVLKNNNIANNKGYGINGPLESISYNDVWNNTNGNYGGEASAGTGDISQDPLFVNISAYDFHLKSTMGRWNGTTWISDSVTSPCIDAGVPYEEDPIWGDYSNEPSPNGGRINMGAYGNTDEASKSGALDTTPPTITAQSPTGTNVPVDTTIGVTFSEAMNQTSAQNAFSITPSASGSFSWEGNKMIFTPTSNLDYLTTYTVTISTIAEDLAGNNLESPYSWQFTTIEEDTTPPVISNVNVTAISSFSATITWTTDEAANSLVKYGTSPGSYTQTKSDSTYVTSHSIILTGLTSNTTYHFVVNSTDETGNSAQSSEYNFTTLSAPKEGDVILWDTNKKYTEKNPFSAALADKANWTQVPYGVTNYTWVGDPMIENEHYYLFLFSNTDDSPALVAKFSDGKTWQNEIYKVYDTGTRDFGHGAVWTEIIKNTADEVIVKSAGKGASTGLDVTTIYKIPKKLWLEVNPVERVNQQGMHDKGRLGLFVFKNVSNDILLDAEKHGDFDERINPPAGCIGLGSLHRYYSTSTDEDFIWLLTFPPGIETNPLTYHDISTDSYWEWDCKPCSPSVDQNFAYLDEKVILGVLHYKDNWKREDVNQYLNAGETYTSSFTAPHAGKWRIFGVMSDDDYYITNYSSEVTVNAGEHFTFKSPVSGTLEYLVIYTFDRTDETPENITTIMDVYREAIGGDVTPPIITNVQTSTITANSATITWDTNEVSDSLVKYGTSSGSYTNTTSNASYVTSHSITLTGLTPNTTYYFVANSTDPYGNSNQSSEYNFTTTAPDITPPNITNLTASSITPNSATITWNTDEKADTKVTYDTNPANLGTVWQNNSELTTSHNIMLTALNENTTYYYRVYSTDAAGNTAHGDVHNFTTLPISPGNATITINLPDDIKNNRLRESTPDTVISHFEAIDVGSINGNGYRDLIWFNLSMLNSTDKINSAKLSLLWNYEASSRNKSTTVGIFRPEEWDTNYACWNNRLNGAAWDNAGGDWYDKNNVAQGSTPYDAITFPGDMHPDYEYHDFDVTELVQCYVNGSYNNTGFFIKADEVINNYISFDWHWENASERPKLIISYSWGELDETPPASISDLENNTGTTWINWTWTNPPDDFNHTMVYLNGTWQTNTSDPYYNATGLIDNTSYEIGTHTVDTCGNVNTTWVNQTTKTQAIPNLPPYKPGNPLPSDGATNISIDTDLSWTGGDPDAGDTVTYDVYFGTNSTPPLVSENQTETNFDPGTLNYSTHYYWKVEAKDEHGASNESEVWEFTTASAPGLVGEWHFDEGTGGIAVDSSGNGNNGTLVNDPVWVDGMINKSLQFDGADDYIEIPTSASLNSINSQITIIAWIKTGFAQRGTIVDNWFYDKTVDPVIGERAFVCTARSGADAGKFDFGLSPQGNGSGAVWLESNTAVNSAQWTHVAFVSNATNMSLYINGSLDAVISAPSQIYQSFRPVHIGAWNAKEVGNPPFGTFFNGTIDEVKIYNRALSGEEIREDYEAGLMDNLGSISGTITYACNETRIAEATTNLTQTEISINSTVTDTNGNYTFTAIPTGIYTVTASKPRFWTNSTSSVTVTAGASTTANLALWLKGDLNTNGISADDDDLTMMKDASVGNITADWKYNLNTNAMFADAGDLAMMKDASEGKIELL